MSLGCQARPGWRGAAPGDKLRPMGRASSRLSALRQAVRATVGQHGGRKPQMVRRGSGRSEAPARPARRGRQQHFRNRLLGLIGRPHPSDRCVSENGPAATRSTSCMAAAHVGETQACSGSGLAARWPWKLAPVGHPGRARTLSRAPSTAGQLYWRPGLQRTVQHVPEPMHRPARPQVPPELPCSSCAADQRPHA